MTLRALAFFARQNRAIGVLRLSLPAAASESFFDRPIAGRKVQFSRFIAAGVSGPNDCPTKLMIQS